MSQDPLLRTKTARAEMMRMARWVGFAYLPIAILAMIIFALVEYHQRQIDRGDGVIINSTLQK